MKSSFINCRLVAQGILLCLFTCIRTATPVTFYFALPFVADCIPSLPSVSLVSGVASAARLLSTALVALYPKECLELLTFLSLCASLFGLCSEFYVDIPGMYQGYWVFVAAVFIFFCSGSSIARALIVTEDSSGDLQKMSNVYTGAKVSVYLIAFVLSALVIDHGCWAGFGLWVCVSYGCIFAMCTLILLARTRSLFWGSLFQLSESSDSIASNDDNNLGGLSNPSTHNRNVLVNFFHDIRLIPTPVWLFVQFTESINVTSGVIALSAVMLVKKNWELTSGEAALFTLLPMAVVLPAFCATTFIPGNLYLKLLVGMFAASAVILLPFLENLWALSIVIFICELSNAVRLSAMTPIMNSFMNSKQVTIRLVSIVTLFSFAYKTTGLSLGSYLFTKWQPLPFVASGIFQFVNAFGLVILKPHFDLQMRRGSDFSMEKKTLLDHQ